MQCLVIIQPEEERISPIKAYYLIYFDEDAQICRNDRIEHIYADTRISAYELYSSIILVSEKSKAYQDISLAFYDAEVIKL